MRIYPHQRKLRSSWLRQPVFSGPYQSWLIDQGSLTARLQQRYAHFSVKPLDLSLTELDADEAALLGLKAKQRTMVRDVLLMGNQHPVVFAHSVLPAQSLRGAWLGLGRLGNQPLGAALFNNPQVVRTPLSYKKLSVSHPLYRKAVQYTKQRPVCLWARRSVFSLHCASILVTEVFLPQLHIVTK